MWFTVVFCALPKEFKIEQIYFDLAGYDISSGAAVTLDKIVKFRIENPTARLIYAYIPIAGRRTNTTNIGRQQRKIRQLIVRSGISPHV